MGTCSAGTASVLALVVAVGLALVGEGEGAVLWRQRGEGVALEGWWLSSAVLR